jgi:hypothetical protein
MTLSLQSSFSTLAATKGRQNHVLVFPFSLSWNWWYLTLFFSIMGLGIDFV